MNPTGNVRPRERKRKEREPWDYHGEHGEHGEHGGQYKENYEEREEREGWFRSRVLRGGYHEIAIRNISAR